MCFTKWKLVSLGRDRSKLNEVSGEDLVLELEGGESLKVGDILFQKLGHRHSSSLDILLLGAVFLLELVFMLTFNVNVYYNRLSK